MTRKNCVLAVCLVFLFSSTAFAAGWWNKTDLNVRSVEISDVNGSVETVVMLQWNSNASSGRFVLPSGLSEECKKQLLAVLLTARSTDCNVSVKVDGNQLTGVRVR